MSEIGTCRTSKFAVLEFTKNIKALEATPKAASVKSTPLVQKAATPAPAPSAPSSTASIDLESLILQTLAKDNVIHDTWEFASQHSVDHQVVIGQVKSLLADNYVRDEAKSTTLWSLSEEGESILNSGSPEYQVFAAVPSEGVSMEILNQTLGDNVVKIGLGPCMKNKWVKKDKNLIVRLSGGVRDETRELLQQVASGVEVSEDDLKNLKKRKLVNQQIRKSYRLEKGEEFSERRQKRCADITREMIGNIEEMEPGTHWSERKFKAMNFSAMGEPTTGGSLHPLLKVRAEFRRILMEMGFQEMPTSKWVESSFWNFDALFQPQSHPARDAHDTFYMKEPRDARKVPEDYYEIVKKTHEVGGFGSIGYGCNFKREETMKNILRTHTTAISAQMLYKLANQEGGFTPQKYFSIDRVFRNETMDATHLCEFHQVEGLVADYNLTLGNLIAIIKTFFEKIGITQLRFKPAYNPYTEPSMEIFGYHPELKKWTEIGNSGMFRPEMLRPMGLPEGVRVIAWGLSLERPTMIKYRIENIRDLFGHKADLINQRNGPIARFF